VTAENSILVGNFDGFTWIRCEGKGSFLTSPALKEFAEMRIASGERCLVVDLGGCTGMESTFMGTLAGISQNLRELGQGSLQVINVAPRNLELMENLGLNFLFGIEAAGSSLRRPGEEGIKLMPLPVDTNTDKDVILSAHQALIAANPANAERFKDVLDYLKHGTPGLGH
jgi:anti-anti-sigma regulatory factor